MNEVTIQIKQHRRLQREMRLWAVLPGQLSAVLSRELGPQFENPCRDSTAQISGNVDGTGKDMTRCLQVCLKRLPGCHGNKGTDLFWNSQVARGMVFCKANFVTI